MKRVNILNLPNKIGKYIVAIPTSTEAEYVFVYSADKIANAKNMASFYNAHIFKREEIGK